MDWEWEGSRAKACDAEQAEEESMGRKSKLSGGLELKGRSRTSGCEERE